MIIEPIDVVIPTKNSERTLKNCLDALFKSDAPINKIFVIDNSRDLTPDIAEKMGCIVVRSDANYCQALRLGASLCETPYFMILDSDIMIHPRFYSTLKPHIKKNFISKGTFYDYITWKSLAKRMLTSRRTSIGGLDAAFVERLTFLQLTKDWESGHVDAGGDVQLYRRCEKLEIPIYQDPELVNLHLIGSHKRYMKQKYWYGKSARTNRIHHWTYFPTRVLIGIIRGSKFAFKERDLRYIPLCILMGWNYFWGWLRG